MDAPSPMSRLRRSSHVCPACGRDLARIRSRREPVYSFFIVACDRCGQVAVTSVPERRARRRRARHFIVAVATLLLQVLMLVGLLAAVTGLCIVIGRVIGGADFARFRTSERVAIIACAVLVPATLGTWLRLGFAHWRPMWPWVVFAALAYGACSFDTILVPALAEAFDLSVSGHPHVFARRLVGLAGILLLAIVGVPLAPVIKELHGHLGRSVWRWRRRRRRRDPA